LPAVKDASEEAEEAGNTALGKLLQWPAPNLGDTDLSLAVNALGLERAEGAASQYRLLALRVIRGDTPFWSLLG